MTRTIYDFEPYLFTREELANQGITRQQQVEQLNHKELIRLIRGVYAYSEFLNSLVVWEQPYIRLISHYKAHPQSIYSHHSAAIFHGLDLLRPLKAKIHVYRPRNSRASGRGLVIHPRIFSSDMLDVAPNGARITNLTTTVIDCARTMQFDEAMVLVESALAKQRIPKEVLQDHMLAYQGHASRKVHRVAVSMSSLSESPGETLVRLLLDELGIVYVQQKQMQIFGRTYRADFYLPEFDVFIEFDGRTKYVDYGSTDAALIDEREREKSFLNSGARIFRTNWNDVFVAPHAFKSKLKHFLDKTSRRVHI